IIAKTERLKKGLMQKLLTKGIGHKEFKDSEIGRIPKEWKVIRIGEVAEKFVSGGTPSTKEPKYWNGDIPWIRSVHLSKHYIDETLIEQYITKEGLENSASNIVPKGNLIIATRVGIGKAAINLIDVAINQDLVGIVINKSKLDPFFAVWCLLSPKISKLLESFGRGTTIKGITQNYIKNLPIPLPPLCEQQKIAEILSTVDKKLELERKRKEKLERIKKSLMNELLTGRKRVKQFVV
ncbi:MAG: restriction endonuclease subunit S, partial [Candidatus Aenigmatarchaeota archaeon]